MKNKFILCLVFALFLLVPNRVYGLMPDDIKNRISECPNIELAEAKEDGSLVKVECYENYDSAKNIMDTTDNDNLVLVENGMIIDAKYALVDYDIDYPSNDTKFKYMDVYTDSKSSNTNGAYIHGGTPDEAAFLGIDYSTKRAKIKVAGLTGWIDKYYRNFGIKAYDIVPIVWVKTPQYYKATKEDVFTHYFPKNIYDTKEVNGTYYIKIDKNPEMLEVGTYYSYDGNYFYTSLKTMLQDYKNGNYDQAVNKDKPYYNYYQYVPFRTLTNHDVDNINLFLSPPRVSDSSKLKSTAAYFINTQNRYGVNAGLMLAISMNESGSGTSELAKNKNNLFGLNAVDAAALSTADIFSSVEDCINQFGYSWLSYKFLKPSDYRFKGANVGNKGEGLNFKYASDPFWGEKAASYYYALDSTFGFLDRNAYQLAVLNNDYNDTVYAKKTPGGENVYQYKVKNSAVVVLAEIEGPSVNGNNIWYKIQSDATLDSNLNISNDSISIYNWGSSYLYVSASYFTKVNEATGNIPAIPDPNTMIPTPTEPETPTPTTPTPIASIITAANYKYNNNIIYGISPSTNIDTIKKNLTDKGGNITITDSNGNVVNGLIGTGMKVNITSDGTETFQVLIYGDTDGDGEISAVDYVRIKNSIMGGLTLEGIYKTASDVNKDGNVDAVDYVNIKNYIMGNNNVISN